MKIRASPTKPNVSPMLAPGQCIIFKCRPNTVKLENTAPEINVKFFMLNKFDFSYSYGFSDNAPFIKVVASLHCHSF